MAHAYNVIDSDGHILEPLTLWKDYLDPAYRDRAPKLVIDSDGKERLLVEEQVLGSQQGMGGIGGVGARQGVVSSETMSEPYPDRLFGIAMLPMQSVEHAIQENGRARCSLTSSHAGASTSRRESARCC